MAKNQYGVSIHSLKERPEFIKTVANRMWLEWWKRKGQTEQQVIDGLTKVLDETPCHDGYVATKDGIYLGSALVIQSDMEERQNYTPWVAAVFVELKHRSKGIGTSIVKHAVKSTYKHGVENIYLCATRKNAPYYEKLGWEKIEEDVGADPLTILRVTK